MGIEKIGLPARPAAEGRSWVLDASSCQTCQTPFSLFNRKHHCRRCGGLFCGNCSNSRVILCGQGDTALRVCEPCKKLEEATRFQSRNRGKSSKGVSKVSSGAEDDLLFKEVFGDSVRLQSLLSGGSELLDADGDGYQESLEVSPMKDREVELKEKSPEKLRKQALEQKKMYSTLKREGKVAEALQAFRRHKELGRQADALELSLKKLAINQRKVLAESLAEKAGNGSHAIGKDMGHQGTLQKESHPGVSSENPKSSKDGKDDDLLKALKDLGWNEADLTEKNPKQGPTSDFELLAEISDSLPKEARSKKPVTQILAHKRRALALKREGKPTEAKEELKKAKLLEKKLEDMVLFGDDDEEEDEDELVALMRTLDKEVKTGKGKDWSLPPVLNIQLSFNLDGDEDEANVDVTDDDANDPSMIAALQAMGWVEEAGAVERFRAPETGGYEALLIAAAVSEQSSLQTEILTYKRRALTLKHEDKLAEAKMELQKAKNLELKLEALKSKPVTSMPYANTTATGRKGGGSKEPTVLRLEEMLEDKDDSVDVNEEDLTDPEMIAALKAMGFEEEETLTPLQNVVKPSPQEMKDLQNEILSIKRSALAFKRQRKAVEAREELQRSRVLEEKLLKMQELLEGNGLITGATTVKKLQKGAHIVVPAVPFIGFVSEDEEEDVKVSAGDFMDPELVAALKSVGWQEEDVFVKDEEPERVPVLVANSLPPSVQPYKEIKLAQKEHARKSLLQKELLAYKRKALALKREGKVEEARLELKQGKLLEKEIEAIENVGLGLSEDLDDSHVLQSKQPSPDLPTIIGDGFDEEDEDVTDEDMQNPELLDALKAFGWKTDPEKPSVGKEGHLFPKSAPVDTYISMEEVCDAGHKLDVTDPTYAMAVTEPYAIIYSASKKQNQVQDRAKNEKNHDTFKNEYGDTATLLDMAPSALDNPFQVAGYTAESSDQGETFDFLSGGICKEPVKGVPGRDDMAKENDSFFWFPPSKDSSLEELQGKTEVTVKGQRYSTLKERSGLVDSRGFAHDLLTITTTKAEAVVSPAYPKEGNLEKVGSPLVTPRLATSVSMEMLKEREAPEIVERIHVSMPIMSGPGTARIQEEIKVHKRKALTLKREGKQNEAREELRQAKLLEKQLEVEINVLTEQHHSSGNLPSSSTAEHQINKASSPVKSQGVSSASQAHKEQLHQNVRQGKERMKLQRESLAHKRKALGLRREGMIKEAEAEFDVAKSLEKQMEELDGGARQHGQSRLRAVSETAGFGMVEDLLDPQLLAALKGLGWHDGDFFVGDNASKAGVGGFDLNKGNQLPNLLVGAALASANRLQEAGKATDGRSQQSQSTGGRSAPAGAVSGSSNEIEDTVTQSSQQVGLPREAGTGSTYASKAQAEKNQLEARIKQEKIRAVELKRTGRQGEALQVLLGAKQLEKELLSMTS